MSSCHGEVSICSSTIHKNRCFSSGIDQTLVQLAHNDQPSLHPNCAQGQGDICHFMDFYGLFIVMDGNPDDLLSYWCPGFPCEFSIYLSSIYFSISFSFASIDYRCSVCLTVCTLSTCDLHSHHWLCFILTYINDLVLQLSLRNSC